VSTLTADRIRNHATKLGLTHLTETITQLVERAETAQMGYLDFVDLLLEEEVGLREGRRFRNALKLSGLPHHKTLDDFDFAFQPGLDARKVRDLATLEFVPARSNIALLGPPGVGKTMLAVALAVAACQAGFSIYFTTLDDLVRRLRTAEATGRFNRQLQAYLRPSVLVCDEVGIPAAGGVLQHHVRCSRCSSVPRSVGFRPGRPVRKRNHGVSESGYRSLFVSHPGPQATRNC
jgi:DNA replication protein DnaC